MSDLYSVKSPFGLIKAGLLTKLKDLETAVSGLGDIAQVADRIGAKVNSLSALKAITASKLKDEQIYVVAGAPGSGVPPKVYVWDADSTAWADDDYVVQHNTVSQGRFHRLAATPLHNHDDSYAPRQVTMDELATRVKFKTGPFALTSGGAAVAQVYLPNDAVVVDAWLTITSGVTGATLSFGSLASCNEIFNGANGANAGYVYLTPGWDAENSVLTLGNAGSAIARLVASAHAFIKTPFGATAVLGTPPIIYGCATGGEGTVNGQLTVLYL
jgi:hypothetical protein